MPSEDIERRFFVLISGAKEARYSEVASVFGPVEPVTVEGLDGEFGFVTDVMTEREYKEKAAKLDGIVHMIRIED